MSLQEENQDLSSAMINVVELAATLAHESLAERMIASHMIEHEDEMFTEEGYLLNDIQDEFNDLYDIFYEKIMNCRSDEVDL